jgi:two-component system chemotaxis response regulator CheY
MDRSAQAEADDSQSGDPVRPLTALIVDDEPHVRLYLRTVLRRLGVVTTWDEGCGETAIKSYQQNLPDVVLLDVNLPHMSGLEIFHRMLEFDPEAAVVVVSSDQSAATIKLVSELGAVGYVLKHMPPNELQAALADALSRVEPRPDAADA